MVKKAITAGPTNDAGLVGSVLGEAFAADPFMAWLFPDRSARDAHIASFWQLMVDVRSDRAHMMASADGGSAALWYRPVLDASVEVPESDDGEDAGESAEAEQNPMVELIINAVGDAAMVRLEGFRRVSEAHPNEPHWYLAAIGTRIDKQGQGQGSAMMAPVLAEADEQGLGCHLESSNPRNLPFYFRHGFEATGEITMPDGKASLTAMWRNPR